jgi:hypothetical protein
MLSQDRQSAVRYSDPDYHSTNEYSLLEKRNVTSSVYPPRKRIEKSSYNSIHPWPRHQMEVSDQLHVQADLLGDKVPASNKLEVVWSANDLEGLEKR